MRDFPYARRLQTHLQEHRHEVCLENHGPQDGLLEHMSQLRKRPCPQLRVGGGWLEGAAFTSGDFAVVAPECVAAGGRPHGVRAVPADLRIEMLGRIEKLTSDLPCAGKSRATQ